MPTQPLSKVRMPVAASSAPFLKHCWAEKQLTRVISASSSQRSRSVQCVPISNRTPPSAAPSRRQVRASSGSSTGNEILAKVGVPISPVQAAFRRATVDFELHGQHIRQSDHLLLLLGAANRDPEQSEDPDTLDLARRDNRHLAFSLGPHFCLGAALARLEGQIALGTLVRRFPNLSLTETD